MAYVSRYEVPPIPAAEPGTEAWYAEEHDRASHLHFIRPTDECFYCGEPLPCEELVYWQGTGRDSPQVWMHADCARRLGTHLIADWGRGPR